MADKSKVVSIASALGITLAATLAMSQVAQADQNPFGASEMSRGYMVAGEGKCGEAKCGESKCGDDKKGGDEGKCGDEKKGGDEGKCGEAKCGDK